MRGAVLGREDVAGGAVVGVGGGAAEAEDGVADVVGAAGVRGGGGDGKH